MHTFFLVVLSCAFFGGQLHVFRRASLSLINTERNWLSWAASAANRSRSRAELLGSLEARLAYDPWRLWLKRLGVAAPLLGVMITAVMFVRFQPEPAGDHTAGTDVLKQLHPLYQGVLIGASLALVNQFLLALLDRKLSLVRLSCEDRLPDGSHDGAKDALVQFEASIRDLTRTTRTRILKTASEAESRIEPFVRATTRAATLIHEIADDHARSRHELSTATTELRDVIQTGTHQLAQAVQTATAAIAGEVQSLSTSLERGSAGIESAAKVFTKTVGAFSRIASSLEQPIYALQTSTTQFQSASNDLMASARHVGERIRSTLEPSLDVVTNAMDAAARECEQGARSLSSSGKALDGTAAALGRGAEMLQDSSRLIVAELPTLNEALTSLTASVAEQGSRISQTSAEVTNLFHALGSEVVGHVKRQTDVIAQDLRNLLDPSIENATATIAVATNACTRSSQALSQVVQTLAPHVDTIDSGSLRIGVAVERLDEHLRETIKTLQFLAQAVKRQEAVLGRLPDELGSQMQSIIFRLEEEPVERRARRKIASNDQGAPPGSASDGAPRKARSKWNPLSLFGARRN